MSVFAFHNLSIWGLYGLILISVGERLRKTVGRFILDLRAEKYEVSLRQRKSRNSSNDFKVLISSEFILFEDFSGPNIIVLGIGGKGIPNRQIVSFLNFLLQVSNVHVLED